MITEKSNYILWKKQQGEKALHAKNLRQFFSHGGEAQPLDFGLYLDSRLNQTVI